MATFKREVERTVTDTEEVKECDYCRLITSDDIGEDEEFGAILLDPTIIPEDFHGHEDYIINRILNAETKQEAKSIFSLLWRYYGEDEADLCPGCINSLFGVEEPTGIRAGTGYLGSSK